MNETDVQRRYWLATLSNSQHLRLFRETKDGEQVGIVHLRQTPVVEFFSQI